MNPQVDDRAGRGGEPHFLLDWGASKGSAAHLVRTIALSLAVHILFALGFWGLLSIPSAPKPPRGSEVRPNVTHLALPRFELTQKAPNRAAVSKEFNLESIRPKQNIPSLPSPGAAPSPSRQTRRFVPPEPLRATTPSPAIQTPQMEPLNVHLPASQISGLSANMPSLTMPPAPKTEERPKIAFENPGVPSGTEGETGLRRMPKPKISVQEAIREAATNHHGPVVGDDTEAGNVTGPSARSSPMPGKLGSSLELTSDPMGVDFSPYLIKVLSAVRRNWYAVIPETARLGRGGKVLIQFAISKDGSVPKLVIATTSGAEALDRAAVAGISASNPFPPLPAEFKGNQIRLQFAFTYNVRNSRIE